MLSIRQRQLGDAAILRCCGTLTAGNDAELRNAVSNNVCARLVIVDLEDVTSLDAAGIGALVEARQRTIGSGCTLKLINVPPQIAYLLQLTGLSSVFEICSVADMIELMCRSRHQYRIPEAEVSLMSDARNPEAA